MRHLTFEQCEQRYPRLIRRMCYIAILSRSEAACALRDFRDGWRGPWTGGEAVCHFGGTGAVVTAAIRARHLFSRLEALYREQATKAA